MVGLGLDWDGTKTFMGSSLAVALELPQSIAQRAVPIGRIVHIEGDAQRRLIEILDGRQATPKLTLALAYPASLLPAEVQAAAAELKEPQPFSRKIRPGQKGKWEPKKPPKKKGGKGGRSK